MKQKTSSILDLLRAFCSLGVFVPHLKGFGFAPNLTQLQGGFAHLCVMVFFVMSGYVISVVSVKRPAFSDFVAARLGRLWAVSIPAIIIALIIELYLVKEFGPGPYTRGNTVIRAIISALFLNEFGLYSTAQPIIGPIWSLAYEFWYYIAFALIALNKSKWKFAFAILIFLAFPKIFLLFPIWLFGVAIHRLQLNPIFNKFTSQYKYMISIVGVLCCYLSIFGLQYGHVYDAPLFYSSNFLPDYIFGFGFSLILLSFDAGPDKVFSGPVIRVGKFFSNFSFSLYLIHVPLLALFSYVIPYNKSNPIHIVVLSIIILIICWLFGVFFEPKRKYIVEKISRLFNNFKPKSNYASR